MPAAFELVGRWEEAMAISIAEPAPKVCPSPGPQEFDGGSKPAGREKSAAMDRPHPLEKIPTPEFGDSAFLDSLRAPYPTVAHRNDSPPSKSRRIATLYGLVAALRAYDAHTSQHSLNVETLAGHLAGILGLPHAQRRVVRVSAMLHDIGKIGVPIEILGKPAKLTAEEYEVVKHHPTIGAKILESIPFLNAAVPLVLHHHEWYDGSGYQRGLRGEEIPLGARIIQAADSIDAMMSPRSYKEGYATPKVICELERGRGRQFDPEVADVAIEWLRRRPVCRPA